MAVLTPPDDWRDPVWSSPVASWRDYIARAVSVQWDFYTDEQKRALAAEASSQFFDDVNLDEEYEPPDRDFGMGAPW
jgi:hypothetical protein